MVKHAVRTVSAYTFVSLVENLIEPVGLSLVLTLFPGTVISVGPAPLCTDLVIVSRMEGSLGDSG